MSENLSEEIARGRFAADELTETAAAFDATRAAIVAKMLQTSVTNPDQILRLHAAAQGLEAAQTALKMTIANGTHAEAMAQAMSSSGLASD